MNGINFVADTNILLYILEGRKEIEPYLDYRCAVSVITEIELLGWYNITKEEEIKIWTLLKGCVLIELSDQIRKRAISIRQLNKIKMADAIILATAQELGLPLLTADKALGNFNGVEILLLD